MRPWDRATSDCRLRIIARRSTVSRMNCEICGSAARSMGRWRILHRYDVEYFRCPSCRFVQVEEPYWLEEAYRAAIVAADVGAVGRSQRLADVTQAVITTWFDPGGRFLDYGAGYG